MAVDTGGTFTDLVVEDDDGSCRMFKAATTPDDPARGVLDVLRVAAGKYSVGLETLLARAALLVHGTTHAINAIITGRTARTAFLTTEGHPDVLVLREGGRSDPFDFDAPFPDPYVPRAFTFEIPGRIGPDGGELVPLDESRVRAVADTLRARAVEAVAVCLLWSVVNPAHEARVGDLLARHLPGVPVTLSHQVNPAVREFRRASSAAVDASLKPLMSRYMGTLEKRLRDAGFAGRLLVITSNAGVVDAAEAARTPISVVNSGPSMAPVAGRALARDLDIRDIIVADTGGTTFDVSLVRDGHIPRTRETWIGRPYHGIMLGAPWVDVKSVGAGGGSIAWVDADGLLHVGPRSAGAAPGPAAYGQGGTEPTVTDACVALGHLAPDHFLGGTMPLDRAAAETAVGTIARALRVPLEQAADAILAVTTEAMVQAILDVTLNQGVDPRAAALVGGGGAAGLNAGRIARRLGCRALLVPRLGAALSASGALMSDLKADFAAVCFARSNAFDYDAVNATLAALSARCAAFAAGPGAEAVRRTVTVTADARYATQVWEIEAPVRRAHFAGPEDLAGFVEDFHAAHRALFGFDDRASAIEIVGWSAEIACTLRETPALRLAPDTAPARGTRLAWFAETGWADVPVLGFDALDPARALAGPALVESAFTTVVVEPGLLARAHDGDLLVTPEAAA